MAKVGDIIARVEAPTLYYRITSKHPGGYFRCLPYQRSGKEIVVMKHSGKLIGDGSVWKEI